MIGILRKYGSKKYFDVCVFKNEYETNKNTSPIAFYTLAKENGETFTLTTDSKLNEVRSTIDGYWCECEMYNSTKEINRLKKKYNSYSNDGNSPISKLFNFFKD